MTAVSSAAEPAAPAVDHRPAIISGTRGASRADLMTRAERAAAGFRRLGIAPGEAVALLMRNDIAFVEASLGAAMAGAYAVPVNWALAADEIGYLLQDSGARAVVAHADLLPLLATVLPAGVTVLPVATPPEVRAAFRLSDAACALPPGHAGWDAWLADPSLPIGRAEPARDSMIYTSGTTGRPKGVRRPLPTAEQARQLAAVRAEVYGLVPGLRTVVAGPLHHIALNSFCLAAARLADRLVLMPRFDPEELLALIERHRVTTLFAVPTMFMRLLRLPEAVRSRYDLGSLRHVVHGGAPCPADVKRAMIDWWGPVIHETYGATELGSVTWCDSREWLERPGTVGRPVTGAEVRILDEAGLPLPPGVPGEVFARSAAYPDFTYHHRPEERRRIARDGMITVGDIGYLDADGYLFLCDRKSDMAIVAGMNVYPAEIEAALLELAAIRDCAVFGVPDTGFGETLLALVVRDGAEPDEAAIRAHLKTRLAAYKVPARIEFRPSLPRDDAGKLRKRELRAPYWQGAGRRI